MGIEEKQPTKYDIIAEERVADGLMGREVWARFLARICDLYFAQYILTFILVIAYVVGVTLLFPEAAEQQDFSWMSGWTGRIILTVFIAIIWLFIEAVIISMFGTTPFKALLGIRVLKEDENRLSLGQSVRRNILVLIRGMGLRLPVVSLIALYLASVDLSSVGRSSWDRQYGTCIIKKPVSKWRWILAIIIFIAFNLWTFFTFMMRYNGV